MATLYSTRFATGSPGPGTTADVYTVPAGYIAIVRDVAATIYTGTSGYFAWGISGGAYLGISTGIGNNGQYQWTGRQVFNAGDKIRISTSSAVTANYAISGYLLSAP